MAITIDQAVLETACKNIIDSILFCLPNAYKGTVYSIGGPPQMIAKRITSGIIDEKRQKIAWGLPERSDYNPPGKAWIDYRDQPGRPLEAMAWCVEKQKSWTAEDPKNDNRSVRLQVEGVWEDFHHMEPVLIRKADLRFGIETGLDYPRNYEGEMLWKDSDYIVVAVIKIHFRPNTIEIGGPETRIIKRLSRALGTELLSYQLKQQSVEAMRQLAQDKLLSCNILADSLRNAISKSGLILSLIKLELAFLREQWEKMVLEKSDKREMKKEAIAALNEALVSAGDEHRELRREMVDVQNRFLDLFLPPEPGENWLRMQIEERWDELVKLIAPSAEMSERIRYNIEQLKKSLYLGKDPDILQAYNEIPESIKKEWTSLIYSNTDRIDPLYIDRLIKLLEDPSLNLPHREKSRKSLIQLKTLAEVMGQLEQHTNVVLRQVLNGCDEKTIHSALDNLSS